MRIYCEASQVVSMRVRLDSISTTAAAELKRERDETNGKLRMKFQLIPCAPKKKIQNEAFRRPASPLRWFTVHLAQHRSEHDTQIHKVRISFLPHRTRVDKPTNKKSGGHPESTHAYSQSIEINHASRCRKTTFFPHSLCLIFGVSAPYQRTKSIRRNPADNGKRKYVARHIHFRVSVISIWLCVWRWQFAKCNHFEFMPSFDATHAKWERRKWECRSFSQWTQWAEIHQKNQYTRAKRGCVDCRVANDSAPLPRVRRLIASLVAIVSASGTLMCDLWDHVRSIRMHFRNQWTINRINFDRLWTLAHKRKQKNCFNYDSESIHQCTFTGHEPAAVITIWFQETRKTDHVFWPEILFVPFIPIMPPLFKANRGLNPIGARASCVSFYFPDRWSGPFFSLEPIRSVDFARCKIGVWTDVDPPKMK